MMMVLLIDIGNTRLKWRYLKGAILQPGGELTHGGRLDPNTLHDIWGGIAPPEAIFCCSVAQPSLTQQLSSWCETQWQRSPTVVTSTVMAGGVHNGYRQAERLGVDRWVAMIGAKARYGTACCVADCGTAVTVDCIDHEGEHLGGLILPGLALMPQCVVANTANVAMTAPGEQPWLGCDTGECLTAGAFTAIVATLQLTAQRFEQQLAQPVTRVITGGDATRIMSRLETGWCHEPDLIFSGLVVLSKEPGRR